MLRAHKTRIRNANPGSSIAQSLSQHDGATRWAYNALLARLNEATQASPAGALWPSIGELAKSLRREKPEWGDAGQRSDSPGNGVETLGLPAVADMVVNGMH